MVESFQEVALNTKVLCGAFNPSDFGVNYPADTQEEELLDKDKKKKENELYEEVITGLRADMIKLGIEITYSSEIIINEVAMNILLMNRLKLQIICRGLLRPKEELKKDHVAHTQTHSQKYSQSISYEKYFSSNMEVNPLFDKLIPKLQKQINEGLKQLGLLPVQQIERQKLTIVKKLRQRYEGMCEEISVEARQETNKIVNRMQVPNLCIDTKIL